MTLSTTAPRTHAESMSVLARMAAHPVAIFVCLSLVFGVILIAVAPPLRGPDETAHFLRAYGIAQGEIIPTLQDSAGRKGILLPRATHREFSLFDHWQSINRGLRFDYRRVFAEVRQAPNNSVADGQSDAVFVPYGGSEGYSPVAYLPQAAAALLARTAGLGFLETLYLMRFAGLLAMTAVVAYALALAPALRWTLVAIAMLPSALYGRAVINADGATFAFALAVIAMFLRAVLGAPAIGTPTRSGWMLACVLSKPPNLAFVLLEWLRGPATRLRQDWPKLAGATVPAIAAALLWTVLSAGDVAAWRLVEIAGVGAEEFDPGWKLRFIWAHPMAFPQAVVGTIAASEPMELWIQVMGVLGLFDTVLRSWVYAGISVLLAVSFISPLDARLHPACALAALLTALAYTLGVLLILYLVWTPVDANHVWGVQGRYFVPVLPLIALAIAALLKRGPDPRLTAASAVACAVLSGAGSVDAILYTDWNF